MMPDKSPDTLQSSSDGFDDDDDALDEVDIDFDDDALHEVEINLDDDDAHEGDLEFDREDIESQLFGGERGGYRPDWSDLGYYVNEYALDDARRAALESYESLDDARLSYEHFDRYEAGRIEIADFFDWDEDGQGCDEVECPKTAGLMRAARELLDLIETHGEPRSRSELFVLSHLSRTLSIWIDPNSTELVEIGGFDRLVVGLVGCSRHAVYVVELPTGWTIVSSRRQIDILAGSDNQPEMTQDFDVEDQVDPHQFLSAHLHRTAHGAVKAEEPNAPDKIHFGESEPELLAQSKEQIEEVLGRKPVRNPLSDASKERFLNKGELAEWLQSVLKRPRIGGAIITEQRLEETFVPLTDQELAMLRGLASARENNGRAELPFSEDFYSELDWLILAIDSNSYLLSSAPNALGEVPIQLHILEDLNSALHMNG